MEHLSNSFSASHDHPFGERFRLADFEEMGVLLNVQTGAFHRLNQSATKICFGFQQGQTTHEVAEFLGKVWRKDPKDLKEVIEGLLADLEVSPPIRRTNPVTFQATGAGLRMSVRQRGILHFDREGRTITAPEWPAGSREELGAALLLAVPHLLMLRHRIVLHAAAVRFPRGALAFCGKSGQGKTTTARVFATFGADLLAEDLLMVSLEDGTAKVIPGAEAEIRQWAAEQAIILTERGRIDAADLDQIGTGPTVPLAEILFLQRGNADFPTSPERQRRVTPSRRQGACCLVRSPLARAEGMVRLLENSFAELGRREVWLDIFQQSHSLACTVPLFLLTVPEGLDVLAAAVAAYIRTLT